MFSIVFRKIKMTSIKIHKIFLPKKVKTYDYNKQIITLKNKINALNSPLGGWGILNR